MGECMRYYFLTITAVALLIGCSSKDEKQFTQVYEKNKAYHTELQKTEKAQLYDGEVTKALLTATYLYTQTEDLNDTRDEKFIVGLYIEDEEGSFESGDYNLTLSGKEPKNVERLSMDDSRLKDISFKSDWSEFFLFTFPHISSKKMTLLFQSDLYGKGELHFSKVAKYVFTKQAF